MPPQTLADGRYRLIERIGSGGMATVWRVWDERLQVERAAKLLTRTDHGLADRFAIEAQVMAQVRHPHVVQVLDFGVQDDMPWLVMELVAGGSLGDRVDEGAMPLVDVLRFGIEMCEGLQAAHDAGVVHRDVKPQNVLVTDEGVAKVTDFGIARVDRDGTDLTVSGMAIGTLAYMAPEQRQDARHVDQRADVYAVGATLYAMASGDRPLELYNPIVARQVYSRVPALLRPIIGRATRFAPDERYASVTELAEALHEASLEPPEVPSSGRRVLMLGAGLASGTLGVVLLGVLGLSAGLIARAVMADATPGTAAVATLETPDDEGADDEPALVVDAPEPGADVDTAEPEEEPEPEPVVVPTPVAVAPVVPAPRPAGTADAAPPEPDTDVEPEADDGPTGQFFVNSRPQATVRIDTVAWGRTPVEGQLPVGSHAIELQHPVFGTVHQPLQVGPTGRAVLCWDLETDSPCLRR